MCKYVYICKEHATVVRPLTDHHFIMHSKHEVLLNLTKRLQHLEFKNYRFCIKMCSVDIVKKSWSKCVFLRKYLFRNFRILFSTTKINY